MLLLVSPMDMKYLFPMGFTKAALIEDVFVVQSFQKTMLSYLYKNNVRKSRDRRKRSYHFLQLCALLRCKTVCPPHMQIVFPSLCKSCALLLCKSFSLLLCKSCALLLLLSSKSILQIVTVLQILLCASDNGRTVVAVVACSLRASEQWQTVVVCVDYGLRWYSFAAGCGGFRFESAGLKCLLWFIIFIFNIYNI